MVQKQKIDAVEQAKERFTRSQAVVLVDYKGLTVAQMTDLRGKLREQDSELKVIKNRLTKLALKEAGCDALDEELVGPIALAFGYTDAVGPSKVCVDFAKENGKLEIRGGLLEGKRIGLQKITALSKLPGREELLTQVAVSMKAPARQMATVLKKSGTRLVYAMKARAEQFEA